MSYALMFAGQGAQTVGMGKELVDEFPECGELFARADEVLGYGLSTICFEGPAERLTKTDICQPAIFVTSAVCLKALELKLGTLSPVGVGGLSLGEWGALYAAGVLTFDDALRVLEARGRYMQDACDATDGGMVSIIGLSLEQAEAISAKTGAGISNINSPGQVVLSGEKSCVDAAAEAATAEGAKRVVPLSVAGAYHSPLMQGAADKLAEVLDGIEFKQPTCPVVSNAIGGVHGTSEEMKQAMLNQITGTVRWVSCVEALSGLGATTLIELGPGKVLSGLLRRIDRNLSAVGVQDMASLDKAVAALS